MCATSTKKHRTIMMIAGEASGDNLGAGVVRVLKNKLPHAEITGIGGQAMRKAGQVQLFDAAKIAVIGVFEIIKHWRHIKNAWRIITNTLKNNPPDILILIDYPGMNLRLAEFAKKRHIKVLYYVSPKVWAWRQGRVKKIKCYVDHMAVIFPFEETLYKKHNVPVTYVGSPIVDTVKPLGGKNKARYELGLQEQALVVTLAPGSRQSEITRLMPVLVKTAQLLQKFYVDIKFVVTIASTIDSSEIVSYFNNSDVQPQITQHCHRAIEASDLLICASGTITLEAAYIGTPHIIIYKANFLTYYIVKYLIKIRHIGLSNIVADKTIVPELIQHAANASNIFKYAQRIIDSDITRHQMMQDFAAIKTALGGSGASEKVAILAIEMM